MRRGKNGAFLAAALASLTPGAGRSDDLRSAATLVADTWKAAGALVNRADARFLFEGEGVTLRLPPGTGEPCQTLAFIGARGLSFHVRVGGKTTVEGSDEQVTSAAGVLEITSCGVVPLRSVHVTSDAGKGALETVVAWSSQPVTALRAILLERNAGVLPASPEPGALPALPTPERRAAVAEGRAVKEGAHVSRRAEWQASADGKGEEKMVLDAGCHEVELFAPDPYVGERSHRLRVDLDAAMRDEAGELIVRDRTIAPDARLETCVGDPTNVSVQFEGAPPNSAVVVTHSSFALPDHLPVVWGPKARARMASAFLPRHIGAFEGDAVFLAQGASGFTPVFSEVEPGGCYVAVAALERGHARGLGLRVTMGARSSADERGTTDDSSAVAFCAGDRDSVTFEVDARGVGVAWGLAAFRVASGVWETFR